MIDDEEALRKKHTTIVLYMFLLFEEKWVKVIQ